MRQEQEPKTGSARHAQEVADFLRVGDEGDGVHLSPTAVEIAEKALRSYAGRGLRRAKAIAWACLIATAAILGARDGNTNGRADIFDYAVAAGEIAGLGSSMTPCMAATTGTKRGQS